MTEANPSRRAVFAGAGAVGIAGVLAACGSDETPSGNGDPNTQPGTTTAPAATTAPPGEVVVAKTSDIPVGGGKVIGDHEIVVTQPAAGNFVGLSAICTHQQCVLAKVESGRIKCGCHGSEFDLNGKVTTGPAKENLPKMPIKVEGDNIKFA
jgi:Rieske Fe-S protein